MEEHYAVENSCLIMGTQEMLIGWGAWGSQSDEDDISAALQGIAIENFWH